MVSAGEMYATRSVFLIGFDRSLLYAWVLNCIVASLGDLNATRICFLFNVEICLLYARMGFNSTEHLNS